MALPDWLSKDYMQSKLRIFHKDDQLVLTKLESNLATGKGENFVGVLTRIRVEFRQGDGSVEQQSYLLKETGPSGTPESEAFIEANVYKREMDMYEFVLPRMSQLLRETGDMEKLHADALCVDRDNGAIILEDLSQVKYVNADRIKKLDYEHTKLTLRMLAKFHGSAFVAMKKNPELFANNFDRFFYSRSCKGYTKIFTGFFKTLTRYVASNSELKAKYHAKLKQLTDHIMEYGARCYDVSDNDFQTLIHGDCWTTNIMFQYDSEGKPTTVLPIDFQFSSLTSSAMDLHYFLNTSLQEDVFDRELELVQYYYYTLRHFLDQLHYEGAFPSLHEFHMQYEYRRFAGLLAMNFQTMMCYEGKDFKGFSDFFEDSVEAFRFQDKLYANKEMQRVVKLRLPKFDAKGCLDLH